MSDRASSAGVIVIMALALLVSMASAEPTTEIHGPIKMRSGANITMGSTSYVANLPNPSYPTDAAPWKSVNAANVSMKNVCV